MNQHLLSYLKSLPSVSLGQLDAVALQNRIDLKFVLNREQLHTIVPEMAKHYCVLEIDGNRIFTYENNYFDTANLKLYHDHHNGYANRIKVRSRKYLETGQSFFEIKKKEKSDRTHKIRELQTEILTELDSDKQQQINLLSRTPLNDLQYILTNRFKRITLVNHDRTERLTIDFDIHFRQNGKTESVGDFFVMEIKQSKSNGRSIVAELLKKQNIREQGFSKYVYGVMKLNTTVKRNNFLPLLKHINKL